jgi:hypothetical protein
MTAIGYRWAPLEYLFIRTGIVARYVKSRSDLPKGSTSDYYIRPDSKEILNQRMQKVEGSERLQTTIDFGVGVYF